MKISPRFILLIFLSHALIFIGFGHAGAILAVTILFSFDLIGNLISGSGISLEDDILGMVGTLCGLGYLVLLVAGFAKSFARRVLYFVGISVLSAGILLFYLAGNSGLFFLPILFAFPFFMLAFLPLYYHLLKRWWHWALD
jgi:hypothetical protein